MVREIDVPAAQMKVLDDGRVERVLLTLLEVLLPGQLERSKEEGDEVTVCVGESSFHLLGSLPLGI